MESSWVPPRSIVLVVAQREGVMVVRAKCSTCQCICEYRPQAIQMTFWTDGRFAYDFFCVKCRAYQRHWATSTQAKELTDAGVRTSVVDVPLEWNETCRGSEEPLTEDFLIDLDEWDGCLSELDS